MDYDPDCLMPRTLFEKIWDAHVVAQEPGAPAVLYVDLHLIHEVTSPQAFTGLRQRGLKVRRPDRTVATMDHSIPTTDRTLPILDEMAAKQIQYLEDNCREFGIPLHGMRSPHRGIVHVIGPELGLTQPGMTIVCGDSHTSTHGALGALAFGIGTSEVEHVLASQCLLQYKAKTCEVRVEGRLGRGVSSKDIILALIAKIGIGGGTGHVFEYTGPAIRALTVEERMTICNMSIEGGARAGMIAPDDVTIEYVAGREFAPQGAAWDEAVKRWRQLPTDEGAIYDKSITLDATELEPMITYGTNPGMGMPITNRIPDPAQIADLQPEGRARKGAHVHGAAARPAAAGTPGERRLHRELHELAHLRSAAGGGPPQGAPGCAGRADAGRAWLAGREEAGGSGRAGRHLQASRRRVARGGLLDVHRHERRSARAGRVRGQHQQSQFRRTTGEGRPDVPGLAADGSRHGDHW